MAVFFNFIFFGGALIVLFLNRKKIFSAKKNTNINTTINNRTNKKVDFPSFVDANKKEDISLYYRFQHRKLEIYAEKLKKLRNGKKTSLKDVVWFTLQSLYLENMKKGNFQEIPHIYYEESDFWFQQNKYKEALIAHLKAVYWNSCHPSDESDFFYDDNPRSSFHKPYLSSSSLLGDSGRCILKLNLSKKDFKEMILNLDLENAPFPFSKKDLLPYYMKAYDEVKRSMWK